MTVYHGSTMDVQRPQIITSDVGRDFGPAFYVTDIREQAERWAVRRARFARKAGSLGAKAVVSMYEFDETSCRENARCLSFGGVSMAWLDMVVKCRSSLAYRHGYDLVEGKIANDSVGETVSYVVAGIMPKEMALEKLKFQQINNQIAFCSEAALRFLAFVKSYEVEMES